MDHHHDIVVIGSSAGGIGIMQELVQQFTKDTPVSIFWVQHLSPRSTTKIVLDSIQSKTKLICKVPEDGEKILRGHIYIAPADHHMIVKKDSIVIGKGPKESRARPSIDTLFRSAAAAFGSRVIGVILSGMLDDGVSGMESIKRCGGRTVIQDPVDAPYAQLPECVLDHIDIDYSVPVSEMGYVLQGLIHQPTKESHEIPADVTLEAAIAERVSTGIEQMENFGPKTPYECPSCGGAMWESQEKHYPHLRCHTGHTYSYPSIYHEKSKKIEESLWVALRLLEERKSMFGHIMKKENLSGKKLSAKVQHNKFKEMQTYIDKIREVILSVGSEPG